MKYEFTIFGFGISAKITSCLLARNGFSVCLISDKDQKKKKYLILTLSHSYLEVR